MDSQLVASEYIPKDLPQLQTFSSLWKKNDAFSSRMFGPVLITLLRNPVGSKTVMSSFTQTILRMHSLRSSFKGFLKKSEVEATAAVNRA